MARKDKRELFEKTPVVKAIAVMAIPSIISQIISLIYSAVDAIFIGSIGNHFMVAAITVAFPVFLMLIALSNLFGVGGGSLMARLSGRREDDAAKSVSAFSVYGAFAVSLAYAILVGAFLEPLLRVLGASDDTIGFAKDYTFYTTVLGVVPSVMAMTASHLLRNAGYSTQASVGLSGGGILNIFLDWLFITRIFPGEGAVKGAAIATMLSNVASCLYLLVVTLTLSKKTALTLDPRRIRSIRKKDVRELFRVGVPSAILTGLFDLGNVALNKLASLHGDPQLAAMGITMKAERIPNAVNVGICQGMLPIVAYNFASGDHDRMRSVMRTARTIGLGVALLSVGLIELFNRPLVGIFLTTSGKALADAETTLAFAMTFLGIRCIASPVQFLNYYTSYCLQAMGDGRDTLLHAVARILLIYIPLMFLLNSLIGVNGLAWALPAGELLGAVVAALLMRSWLKKHTIPA